MDKCNQGNNLRSTLLKNLACFTREPFHFHPFQFLCHHHPKSMFNYYCYVDVPSVWCIHTALHHNEGYLLMSSFWLINSKRITTDQMKMLGTRRDDFRRPIWSVKNNFRSVSLVNSIERIKTPHTADWPCSFTASLFILFLLIF